VIAGTVLALVAALCNAFSAFFQQNASHVVAAQEQEATPHGGRATRYLPVLEQVPRLLRTATWWGGWTLNTVGTLVQAVALHASSVALVQPVMSTQLVFALPLSTYEKRMRPVLRDWLAVVAICTGVVVFLSVRGAAPAGGGADRPAVLLAIAVMAGVAAVLIAAAVGRPANVRAALVGVAAGLCNAASAVLIKLTTTDLLDRGVLATAVDWPGYGLAVATLVGVLLAQQAYAAGSLSVAVAAMTVTNPIVSYVVGILAFDVAVPKGAGTLTAVAISLALVSVGAVGLAHSPTIRRGLAPQRG
jgi:drug/metabolite transporter (DMT)-like permease